MRSSLREIGVWKQNPNHGSCPGILVEHEDGLKVEPGAQHKLGYQMTGDRHRKLIRDSVEAGKFDQAGQQLAKMLEHVQLDASQVGSMLGDWWTYYAAFPKDENGKDRHTDWEVFGQQQEHYFEWLKEYGLQSPAGLVLKAVALQDLKDKYGDAIPAASLKSLRHAIFELERMKREFGQNYNY